MLEIRFSAFPTSGKKTLAVEGQGTLHSSGSKIGSLMESICALRTIINCWNTLYRIALNSSCGVQKHEYIFTFPCLISIIEVSIVRCYYYAASSLFTCPHHISLYNTVTVLLVLHNSFTLLSWKEVQKTNSKYNGTQCVESEFLLYRRFVRGLILQNCQVHWIRETNERLKNKFQVTWSCVLV